MRGIHLVLTTAPDRETGEEIGGTLVRERLAACANVVPGLRSIFRWEGAVELEDEVLVLLKTREETVDALLERGPELHPYDVPEFLVLPVHGGHGPYLEWVMQESGPPVDERGEGD